MGYIEPDPGGPIWLSIDFSDRVVVILRKYNEMLVGLLNYYL